MKKIATSLTIAVSLALAACGGGSTTVTAADAVPDTVTTSATAVTSYISDLTNTPEPQLSTAEPVAVPDKLAVDDLSEPKPI